MNMTEICPVCGLPKDLCVCDQINEEKNTLRVFERYVKRAKFITEISGLKETEIVDMFKSLKKDLACGGTIKKNVIELQGKHKDKVINFLLKKGYARNQII